MGAVSQEARDSFSERECRFVPHQLGPHLFQILAEHLDRCKDRLPCGIASIADCISGFLCGLSLHHGGEQLHLAEFAAREVCSINFARDMDILVRKKPFREEKRGGFVNGVDSDVEGERRPDFIRSEFLGGLGEGDAPQKEDVDGDVEIRRRPLHFMFLGGCGKLLTREVEVERAHKPGRHREADVPMKGYMGFFGPLLHMSLPASSRLPAPGDLCELEAFFSFGAAKGLQQAVAKELRMEKAERPNAQEQSLDDAMELQRLLQLQQRSQAKEEQACTMVPLEDI